MGWSEDAARNREAWTKGNAEYTDARADIAWAKEEIDWGIWDHPESDVDVLGDVDGLDVVELGCGTAYFSAWLAKRGARPVGVDVTPAQLETARRLNIKYKLGLELFRDIEKRWDTGRFGKEYDECESVDQRRKWDTKLGQAREKIFEVRRVYNDVNFIDEFMTPEWIEKHKFYQYGRDPHTGQLRIVSRDPVRIKQTLLYQLTNMGRPFIYVVDGNYCNRGELYMAHRHNGLDIEIKYALETLKNVYKLSIITFLSFFYSSIKKTQSVRFM